MTATVVILLFFPLSTVRKLKTLADIWLVTPHRSLYSTRHPHPLPLTLRFVNCALILLVDLIEREGDGWYYLYFCVCASEYNHVSV